MNDLYLVDLYAMYEYARVTCEVNDGSIVQMYIEGGNDNE